MAMARSRSRMGPTKAKPVAGEDSYWRICRDCRWIDCETVVEFGVDYASDPFSGKNSGRSKYTRDGSFPQPGIKEKEKRKELLEGSDHHLLERTR